MTEFLHNSKTDINSASIEKPKCWVANVGTMTIILNIFTRSMILSQIWSNFDVLSLRALNCLGKMKIYYTDERLRAHTITYRVRMNKDEFFAMVFSFSFGSLFNNLCPATHSTLLYFLCSFLPVYSFPWTNTKSSTQ